MSTFDLFVTQPILNVILAIYAIVGDMGVAVIIFAIIVRLLMWRMIKKQLHQSRLMRQIQPELKRIKAEAAGDKQKEGQLMMELYKERGVKPFASLTPLLIQVPVFFALYQIALLLTTKQAELGGFFYSFMKDISTLGAIAGDPSKINEHFLGFIDLAHSALTPGGMDIPLLGLVLISAALQFYQSKQLMPEDKERRRLRDLLRPRAGEQVDATEMNQALMSKMLYIFPIFAIIVGVYLPGILMIFYAASSAIAIWQQKRILDQDVDEMEIIAEKKTPAKPKKPATTTEKRKNVTVRVTSAIEAEVVKKPHKKTVRKKKGKRS